MALISIASRIAIGLRVRGMQGSPAPILKKAKVWMVGADPGRLLQLATQRLERSSWYRE